MRKGLPRGMERLRTCSIHRASKWQSWDLKLGKLTLEPMLYITDSLHSDPDLPVLLHLLPIPPTTSRKHFA